MNAYSVNEIITDAELDFAFCHANIGELTKREVIYDSLLKCLGGYKTGHTAELIYKKLGLVYANKWDLTQKGIEYLYLSITK